MDSIPTTDLLPEAGPLEPWEPDKWTPRHQLVARLAGTGFKPAEIALITGYSKGRVHQIIEDQRAREGIREAAQTLADNIGDLHLKLRAVAHEALAEIVDQMRNGTKQEVRQRASLAILDRAGYTPVQRHALVAPPAIPPELAAALGEAHADMRAIKRTVSYALPAGQEVASVAPPDGEEAA